MSNLSELSEELKVFGAPSRGVIFLDVAAAPEHIPYLDLLRSETSIRPDAVVEVQGRPVIFVTRGKTESLPKLRKTLALRDDGSFLGVIEPGRLSIYQVDLGESNRGPWRTFDASDEAAPNAIPALALNPPPRDKVEAVHDLLFRLLGAVTDDLVEAGLSPDDSLSLAGRALFMRFLLDREIVKESDVAGVWAPSVRFADCFKTAEDIAATSEWLNGTFNGDLLPLSAAVANGDTWFRDFSVAAVEKIGWTLTSIMLRTEGDRQMRLDWRDLNFAHVPVGLLSQVYERHVGEYHSQTRRETSAIYTPRAIAEYMVSEAFSALPEPHNARVLDPAAGGGVFLVAAFRKLVEARWAYDTVRPTTEVIRSILNQQLAGFEINESALRLSSLSLYLTALELDPDPRPLGKLRFDELKGKVLFDLSDRENGTGSLGDLGHVHRGAYDLVIGNPPWTVTQRTSKFKKAVLRNVRSIVASRLDGDLAKTFTLPDIVPDLAFLWRAMEWAKPGAQIALALHARLLFKRGRPGFSARQNVFRSVHVTGVLNGASLIGSAVWPEMKHPFCLLFARNERSRGSHAFYFVTPELERSLNSRGLIRVDSKAARQVSVTSVETESTILKTLFQGTSLDATLLKKISERAPQTLGEYWDRHGLAYGEGYQVVSGTSSQDASQMLGLPELQGLTSFEIPTETLPKFLTPRLHRTRDPRIYKGPVVLIRQSPGPSRSRPRAGRAMADVAFDESVFGYSCAGFPQPDLLSRYLLLLANSSLFQYIVLMTSAQFGVERRVYLDEDVELQPFVDPEMLSTDKKARLISLTDQMFKGAPNWAAIDAWVSELYDLNVWECELVADALAIQSPFAASRNLAQTPPSPTMANRFASRVARDVAPFVGPKGSPGTSGSLSWDLMNTGGPWIWLILKTNTAAAPRSLPGSFVREADDWGTSQIFVAGKGWLAVGILAESRYWTVSRARLLTLEIVQSNHFVHAISNAN